MAEELIEGNTPEIGTELDVAAKFWGKELALENGEELPEEDNQLEPESESEEEVELEEADSEEVQEEEYEELEEEEEPEEKLFEVKSDGESKQVTLQELKDNWSKGQNYTQKSQGLSEERKAFDQELAESRQMREQAISILENAQAQTQPEQHDDAYWQNLKDTDPMQWMIERDALREAEMQTMKDQQQLEQLKYQKDAERQAELGKFVESQHGELKKLIPEWDNTELADAEKKLVIEYGKKVGFTEDELDNAYDARAVATMRKAALYDQLTEKRKGLKPVARKSMKAGSQSGEPSKLKAGKAAARLKKSGHIDDAAGVFFNMIRSK
ncbi:uncharacterized protein METZ01_LOCUS167123 [marine metagenome]|uniref:Scaffolding protein n=1 Tax=marine metagenome TaxID=408172 RepID=A0A382BKX4_9ZZZZ